MSEWISVKERLPEDSEFVNICFPNYEGVPIVGWAMFHDEPDPFFEHGLDDLGLDEVTHWMPLPAPPEVADEHQD